MRDRLLIRMDQLIDLIVRAENEIEIGDGEGDDLEKILDFSRRDQATRDLERLEGQLAMVSRALRKPDEELGVCERCEEEITPKRLMALPEAKLCIECQEKEERKK